MKINISSLIIVGLLSLLMVAITFLKGTYYDYADAWFPAWLISKSPEDATDKKNYPQILAFIPDHSLGVKLRSLHL